MIQDTASAPLAITAMVFVGVLGLLVGSFLNVVIYRVPAGKSIVSPPSACPNCGAGIKWYDNVPVVSWLLLRGKCRNCTQPISIRYPLIELGTGIVFALVAIGFAPALVEARTTRGALAALFVLLAVLYLSAIGIALIAIDLDTHRLPNPIVLPAYVVGVILFGLASTFAGDWTAVLRAVIGAIVLFTGYLALALIYPGGMEFGDVKLAGVLGLWLGWFGWGALAIGAFSAFLFGGLFSIVLLLTRRASRKSGIPFGPWMVLGSFAGIAAGERIFSKYLELVGLS
jgi:leader peptidase (prepilin peptidase)/N-methyltransferase